MTDQNTPDGRYDRQTRLPGIGPAGQARLADATVLLVGCGALGTVIADQLARAGVGTLRIVDRDLVEWSNLQRQVLFCEEDAREGRPKAEAAADRLGRVNSAIRIEAEVVDFNHRNAERLAAGVDLLLDGTDNFETRYLLNDVAVRHGIPMIYGGAVGTRGMAMPILPDDGPCLRCLFDAPPPAGSTPTCDTAGILGPVASIVASVQAGEAIKLLVGATDRVSRSLLEFDLWEGERRRIGLADARRPDCPCCARGEFEYLSGALTQAAVSLCGRDAVQVLPPADAPFDLEAVASKLASVGAFSGSGALVRGRLTGEPGISLTVFADGRTIVHGTDDPERARSLCARYIGA